MNPLAFLVVTSLGLAPLVSDDGAAKYPTGYCDEITEGMPGLNDSDHLPTQTRLIGRSVGGRQIWAELWGPPSATTVYLILGQVHGNECSPSLLVDEIRRNPPTRYAIWLIPTLTPDGYAEHERPNNNGVDLNGNGFRRDEPETIALFDFVAEIRPTLALHIHSPGGYINTFGGDLAEATSRRIATGLDFHFGEAGGRTDRNRWFLWQGLLAEFELESILIELHAVSHEEVPTARPRPAARAVEAIRADARTILAALAPDVVAPDVDAMIDAWHRNQHTEHDVLPSDVLGTIDVCPLRVAPGRSYLLTWGGYRR